jgi:hypothetical protein
MHRNLLWVTGVSHLVIQSGSNHYQWYLLCCQEQIVDFTAGQSERHTPKILLRPWLHAKYYLVVWRLDALPKLCTRHISNV